MRKTAYISSIVVGLVLIIGGIGTWIMVSTMLADQNITVAEDASCLAGDDVNGPLSAFCEARVIDMHAREATGGKTYAELDRDDPLRATAQSAAFLQSSLFTSVVAFGVAAMGILMGIIFVLLGLGMKDVGDRSVMTT
jgi:ABC-type sugar transport system permease subunit